MNHSEHTVTDSTRYCPVCKADWRGPEIPEKYRHCYASSDGYFSRLIGVEIRGKYDGVDHWKCPDCSSTFKR